MYISIEKFRYNKTKYLLCTLVISIMLLSLSSCGFVSPEGKVKSEVEAVAKQVKEMAPRGNMESLGGTWALIGMIRSRVKDLGTEKYKEEYYNDVRAKLKAKKGILDKEYYTTYERTAMGVKLVGKDPENIDGYNIAKYVDDYEKVTNQGPNAVAFALISSNMAGFKLKNEEKYINSLISDINSGNQYSDKRQLDYATMAIQGLSYYKNRDNVNENIEKWLEAMGKLQEEDGSMGNCESTVEMIIALTSIGKDPLKEKAFTKNGKTLLDGLLSYKVKGGYAHAKEDNKKNIMATEKALLGLTSMKLYFDGEKLYQIGK